MWKEIVIIIILLIVIVVVLIVEKERVEREKFEIPGNWFVFSAWPKWEALSIEPRMEVIAEDLVLRHGWSFVDVTAKTKSFYWDLIYAFFSKWIKMKCVVKIKLFWSFMLFFLDNIGISKFYSFWN